MTEPSVSTRPRTLHIISHTHWDREWYLTFQQFRFRLVQLVDRLMDILDRDPEFRFFHLDAQTITVEDYLAVKPQNRERLLAFIRSGRILIGPWYQQNDVFLTSGEATIRNLLIGHRMAEEYGGPDRVMKIGYVPDQFGLNSQLPQILRGFGISTAVHGRGLDMPRDTGCMEYWWEGPDGSRVLASYLAFWYNNFERIPDDLDAAIERVDHLERIMGPVSKSRHLLFMNGVDHFEAQANLIPQMKAVNACREGGPAGRLVSSSLPDYFAALEQEVKDGLDLPVHSGELRDGPSLGGLPGTLSSRVNLKQENAKCQALLEKYAEPLASIAWSLGEDYPQDFLTYAWKLLMQNHPHDSICGCSQDQVHREMEPRFEQVEQVADEIINRAFAAAAQHLPPPAPVDIEGRQTTFAVFNPLSFARTDTAEVVIDFPLGRPGRQKGEMDPDLDVEFLLVFDENGNPVPHHVLKSEIAQERVLSPTVLPMAQMHRRFTVQVRAEDVPPLGFKTFRAVGQTWSIAQSNAGSTVATGALGAKQTLIPYGETLDNGIVQVMNYNDGSFEVRSLNEKGDWEDEENVTVNVYQDGGDVGDQYVYRAPRRDTIVSGDTKGQTEVVEDTPLSAAVRVRSMIFVPVSATPDREARSEERVPLETETVIRVRAGQPYVEVATTVHNTARDHRLRSCFPLPGWAATDRTVAQVPFDVVARERVPVERLSVVAGQHPHEQWVSIYGVDEEDGEAAGLTVLTNGLYEHELLSKGNGILALTLLRCSDRLTMEQRDPLGHDRAGSGQCPGTHTFHYAVLPHRGTWEQEKVWKHAHAFNAPLRAMQTPEPQRGNPDLNRPYLGTHTVPRAEETLDSYLTLEPDTLVLSAYKRAHDRDTQIVRFWNIGTDRAAGIIGIRGARRAWRVNMNEERQAELPMLMDGMVTLDVGPKEIVTLEFGF